MVFAGLLSVASFTPLVAASVDTPDLDQEVGTVTINAVYSNGTQINGMWVELQTPDGLQDIAAGFTPITFTLNATETYTIVANNWTQQDFVAWNIPNAGDPLHFGVAADVNATLTAFYVDPSGN